MVIFHPRRHTPLYRCIPELGENLRPRGFTGRAINLLAPLRCVRVFCRPCPERNQFRLKSIIHCRAADVRRQDTMHYLVC